MNTFLSMSKTIVFVEKNDYCFRFNDGLRNYKGYIQLLINIVHDQYDNIYNKNLI